MSEETRMILGKLDEISSGMQIMQSDITELKVDVSGLKEDVSVLKADVSGLKEDVSVLKTDVSGLKEDVADLKSCVIQLSERVGNMETEVHVLRLVMENETNKKIDAIGEGHDFLIQHYLEAKGMVKAKEKMELDILGLKADMRMVKAKVGIA